MKATQRDFRETHFKNLSFMKKELLGFFERRLNRVETQATVSARKELLIEENTPMELAGG